MYGQNPNEFPYDYSSHSQPQYYPPPETTASTHRQFQSPPLYLPPLAIPGGEHDSLAALRSELAGYTSSGCSSYGGSPTSITSYGGGAYSPTQTTAMMMQRSISSHSLHKNLEVYSPMDSSPPMGRFFDLEETSSVRKALSTGDLQGVNMGQQNQNQNQGYSYSNSPLATESSIIESMNRASPYSPEEKRERIERYRSKRNLRNFNKKIKYECRKTLADSRPRIRGRFARNDETDVQKMIPQGQWDQTGIDEDIIDEDDENWIQFLDSFSANMMP